MSDIHDVERLMRLAATVPHRAKCSNVQVRVPRPTLRRFRQLLPMHGALSWYLRNALEEFAHQGGDVTEEEHITFMRERVAKLIKKPKKASARLKW